MAIGLDLASSILSLFPFLQHCQSLLLTPSIFHIYYFVSISSPWRSEVPRKLKPRAPNISDIKCVQENSLSMVRLPDNNNGVPQRLEVLREVYGSRGERISGTWQRHSGAVLEERKKGLG